MQLTVIECNTLSRKNGNAKFSGTLYMRTVGHSLVGQTQCSSDNSLYSHLNIPVLASYITLVTLCVIVHNDPVETSVSIDSDACSMACIGVGTGGARGAMPPPVYLEGGQVYIWPPHFHTPHSPGT